jgi:hypothetical protein
MKLGKETQGGGGWWRGPVQWCRDGAYYCRNRFAQTHYGILPIPYNVGR